jgi:hypothetical protein
MTTAITRTVYELLQFVATWLQQPTVIEVASAIEVTENNDSQIRIS